LGDNILQFQFLLEENLNFATMVNHGKKEAWIMALDKVNFLSLLLGIDHQT
jgi:hypothetical protein